MKMNGIRSTLVALGLLLAVALLAWPKAISLGPSRWDGQYEVDGEGMGGVPFHHNLILHTVGGCTRVILNSKELSDVVRTSNGFHGKADGKLGHFPIFLRVKQSHQP